MADQESLLPSGGEHEGQQVEQGGMSDLDRIALEAAAEEQAQEAKEDAALHPERANLPDPATAWAQIPAMFGGLLGIAMPELKEAYTEAACMQWGGAMAQVADKYGWDAGETMSRFAPEIALVVATLPLALPTAKAISERRKKAALERPAAPPRPDNGLVDTRMPIDPKTGLPIGGNFVAPD